MAICHIDRASGFSITFGPRKVILEDRGEPRWCFGCRARKAGVHQLLDYDEPSYYEPIWVYRCDGCGDDRRLGFGRSWVWS